MYLYKLSFRCKSRFVIFAITRAFKWIEPDGDCPQNECDIKDNEHGERGRGQQIERRKNGENKRRPRAATYYFAVMCPQRQVATALASNIYLQFSNYPSTRMLAGEVQIPFSQHIDIVASLAGIQTSIGQATIQKKNGNLFEHVTTRSEIVRHGRNHV